LLAFTSIIGFVSNPSHSLLTVGDRYVACSIYSITELLMYFVNISEPRNVGQSMEETSTKDKTP
jgi:hypothetical protein